MKLRALTGGITALLLAASCVSASAQSKKNQEMKRVSSLFSTLDFSLDKRPDDWRIVIITDPKDWTKLRANFKTEADIAFTYLAGRVTYLNAQQIDQLDNKTLQWSLGHEMGHVVCGCNDEKKADEIADRLAWRNPDAALSHPAKGDAR